MPEGYASKPPVKAGTTDGAAPSFTITSASLSDVDSLSTIVARSFHPVNPYFAKVCPDTPAVREWWSKSFLTEINGPGICHPLVAIENSSNAVVGILALRLMEASDKGSGIWSTHPITPDHYADAYRSMIGVMTEQRESLMRGKRHFMLQLFGVDHRFQGRHLGQQLLARACDIADQAGYETFVQANGSAEGLYRKFGFEMRDRKVVPGDDAYVEYMLVRRPKTAL